MSCGVGRRCGSDPAFLWHRLEAAVPIGPLAWEPPYVVDAALGRQKDQKKKKKKSKRVSTPAPKLIQAWSLLSLPLLQNFFFLPSSIQKNKK